MNSQLLQMMRRLRGFVERPPFSVRHWQPTPPLNGTAPASAAGNATFSFDVLWRTAPAKYSKVEVDAPFHCSENYPLPGTTPLDVIEIRKRNGEPYLALAFCPVTGVIFHRRLPPPDRQARYYGSEWDTWRTVPAPDEMLRQRPDKVGKILGNHIRSGMRVLDVGCGYGDQLLHLKKRGCDVVGVEASRHRAQYAQEQMGIPVFNCPIEGDEIQRQLAQEKKFDLIYLNQVLEHLNNPLAALRTLKPLLSDSGALMIGVPNLFGESLATFCDCIVHTHSFSFEALRNYAALASFSPFADLSFPGYLYVLFKPVATPPALLPPNTRRVLQYVAKHFDLSGDPLKPGNIISVFSSYTGKMELGLRVISAPEEKSRRDFASLIRAGDIDRLRAFFPIVLNTPYERATLWQK